MKGTSSLVIKCFEEGEGEEFKAEDGEFKAKDGEFKAEYATSWLPNERGEGVVRFAVLIGIGFAIGVGSIGLVMGIGWCMPLCIRVIMGVDVEDAICNNLG